MKNKKAIAVFDIGKTNKKIILFDEKLNIIREEEQKFEQCYDESGFECDDIERIETWIKSSIIPLVSDERYDLRAVNFCSYGAAMIFLDKYQKRLTPLYNYMKEVSLDVQQKLFDSYGGKTEFCRNTGSPSYGKMLNSGIQLLWLKDEHPDIFKQVKWILHLPQYLSYLLTGEIFSESTSIGCHTFLWDFDNHKYHRWLKDYGLNLPHLKLNSYSIPIVLAGKKLESGIGIHDSTASIVPFSMGSNTKYILISTGTWCITMNPFNHSGLTKDELEKECMVYLNIDQQSIKSSRFFLGHIHDVNVKRLTSWFNVKEDSYKLIRANIPLLKSFFTGKKDQRIFFNNGIPENYIDAHADLTLFKDFSESYHRFMFDLVLLNAESIRLISSPEDDIKHYYISGGFASNEIYTRLIATLFPEKKVFTAQVNNSSALGAALVIWHTMKTGYPPDINLNLHTWEAIL